MKRNSFSGLTCTEAAKICDKAEYREAGLVEKLRLQLHLFFCRTCKDYNSRNRDLSSLLNKAKIEKCSSEEKEAYKRRMKENSESCKKP